LFERRKPLIVPIFIPFHGCPHRCIYCQQEKITDQTAVPVSPAGIKETLDSALRSPGFDKVRDPEIAFYGGTFTNLPIDRIFSLLQTIEPYISRGLFKSIRISTRPDSIDNEKLALLRDFRVTTVELGAQSMDDHVLALTRRGHRAQDTVDAVRLLKQNGFRVGIQLMPGLPGDSERAFMKTVETVIGLQPDMVRLYPTVVLRGTVLAAWYLQKRYQPLELTQAVDLCIECCDHFESNGIPVIRLGLMSSPSLLQEGEILAGPWHRSFGFLVRSGIHQKKIAPFLPKKGEAKEIRLRVPYREITLVRGYKNRGLLTIGETTGATITEVIPDESVFPGEVGVDLG
jgi:histone acetyltransferase (RNA polymerase elongator complex component)